MRKLKIILCGIIITLFWSCQNGKFKDTPQNRFIVKELMGREGMSKMVTYKVLMLDDSGIGEKEFWISDSLGKYNIGDVMILQPLNEEK